jgi:two-component system, NtrC family, response regulator AtoC
LLAVSNGDKRADLPTVVESSSTTGGAFELVLMVVWRDGRSSVFPIVHPSALKIGRGRDCQIQIEEPGVSRTHALLHVGKNPSVLSIEDLGSSNGTRFRGEPMPPRTPQTLRPGDTFEIGGLLLTVQHRPVAASAGATTTEAVPPSEAMSEALQLADRVARGTISVLILGETGVGKDVLARRIHMASPRAARPLLRLNCGALSESLIDSELFGHEKGSFTGASHEKPGLVETADHGTVFLDEVGELPPATQVKLLRVIEQGEFFRVGSVRGRKVDVRFIAATNRDLAAAIADGSFREDLFFRLAGTVLKVPPLRQRVGEILPFARMFLAEAAKGAGSAPPTISDEAATWLETYDWPGNLRELRNTMERAALMCRGGTLAREHVVVDAKTAGTSAPAATDDRERVIQALARFGGNQTLSARFLGISRNTLIARIQKYGLARPKKTT